VEFDFDTATEFDYSTAEEVAEPQGFDFSTAEEFDFASAEEISPDVLDLNDPATSDALFEERYPAEEDPSMYRADGSVKSAHGFLGPVENKVSGGTMTEVSVGMEIDGEEVEVPVMVPTLTQEEIDFLANNEIEGNAKNFPESILVKAREHAVQRMAEGKSVFYVDGEDAASPDDRYANVPASLGRMALGDPRKGEEVMDDLEYFAQGEGDDILDATVKQIENLPERGMSMVGGAFQATGEVSPYEMASDLGARLPAGGMYGLSVAGQAEGKSGLEFVTELARANEIPELTEKGQEIAEEALAEMQLNAPDVQPGTLPFYVSTVIGVTAEMLPAVATSVLLRNPWAGLSIIGSQVYTSKYAESREEGRTVNEATADAYLYAASETITERIPLGILTKEGGSGLAKILKASGAEGLQEPINQAIQMAYDLGIDEDKTLADALENGEVWTALRDAAVIGFFAGGTLATGTVAYEKAASKLRETDVAIDQAETVDDAVQIAEELLDEDIAAMPLQPEDETPSLQIPEIGEGTIETDGEVIEYKDGEIVSGEFEIDTAEEVIEEEGELFDFDSSELEEEVLSDDIVERIDALTPAMGHDHQELLDVIKANFGEEQAALAEAYMSERQAAAIAERSVEEDGVDVADTVVVEAGDDRQLPELRLEFDGEFATAYNAEGEEIGGTSISESEDSVTLGGPEVEQGKGYGQALYMAVSDAFPEKRIESGADLSDAAEKMWERLADKGIATKNQVGTFDNGDPRYQYTIPAQIEQTEEAPEPATDDMRGEVDSLFDILFDGVDPALKTEILTGYLDGFGEAAPPDGDLEGYVKSSMLGEPDIMARFSEYAGQAITSSQARPSDRYFHGRGNTLGSLVPTPHDETGIPGISASIDPNLANRYASVDERVFRGEDAEGVQSNVVPFELDGDIREYGEFADEVAAHYGREGIFDVSSEEILEYAKENNIAAIDYSENLGEPEISVLDPSRIRYLDGAEEPDVMTFRSGISTVNDLEGYRQAGSNIGVSLPNVRGNKNLEGSLVDHVKSDGHLFIDSGAFSEPLEDAAELLDEYRLFLSNFSTSDQRSRVTVVAPDIVGDQEGTLEMQRQHRSEISMLENTHGASVLIPIQRGDKSFSEVYQELQEVFPNIGQMGIAIPANKAAATVEEVQDLMSVQYPPRHVHLLGISEKSRGPRYQQYVDAITAAGARVTTDASSVRGLFGEGRAGTAEMQRLQELVAETEDETELYGLVSEFMTDDQAKEIAIQMQLNPVTVTAENFEAEWERQDPEFDRSEWFMSAFQNVVRQGLNAESSNADVRQQAISNVAEVNRGEDIDVRLRNVLSEMSHKKLKDVARDAGVMQSGTREELTERLLDVREIADTLPGEFQTGREFYDAVSAGEFDKATVARWANATRRAGESELPDVQIDTTTKAVWAWGNQKAGWDLPYFSAEQQAEMDAAYQAAEEEGDVRRAEDAAEAERRGEYWGENIGDVKAHWAELDPAGRDALLRQFSPNFEESQYQKWSQIDSLERVPGSITAFVAEWMPDNWDAYIDAFEAEAAGSDFVELSQEEEDALPLKEYAEYKAAQMQSGAELPNSFRGSEGSLMHFVKSLGLNMGDLGMNVGNLGQNPDGTYGFGNYEGAEFTPLSDEDFNALFAPDRIEGIAQDKEDRAARAIARKEAKTRNLQKKDVVDRPGQTNYWRSGPDARQWAKDNGLEGTHYVNRIRKGEFNLKKLPELPEGMPEVAVSEYVRTDAGNSLPIYKFVTPVSEQLEPTVKAYNEKITAAETWLGAKYKNDEFRNPANADVERYNQAVGAEPTVTDELVEEATAALNEERPEEQWTEDEVRGLIEEDINERYDAEDPETEAESEADLEAEGDLAGGASAFNPTDEQVYVDTETVEYGADFWNQRALGNWNDPQRKVVIERLIRESGEMLTLEEADQIIDEWEAEAIRQGQTGENRGKIVLSLFDETGIWANPWALAGYDVRTIDLAADGVDVMDINPEWFDNNMPEVAGGDVHMVLAACPCTEFSVAGNKFKPGGVEEKENAQQKQDDAAALVHQTMAIIDYLYPKYWAIENPVGTIERLGGLPKARLTFHPHHFGFPYSKKTLIWGNFHADLPTANVDPQDYLPGLPKTKENRRRGEWQEEYYPEAPDIPILIDQLDGSQVPAWIASILHKTGKKEPFIGGSWAHDLRGDVPAHKQLRSQTPLGFSYAFFMANSGARSSTVLAMAEQHGQIAYDNAKRTERDLAQKQAKAAYVIGAYHGDESYGLYANDTETMNANAEQFADGAIREAYTAGYFDAAEGSASLYHPMDIGNWNPGDEQLVLDSHAVFDLPRPFDPSFEDVIEPQSSMVPQTISELGSLIETQEDIPKNYNALKDFVAENLGREKSSITQADMKEAQEMLEVALVRLARDIVHGVSANTYAINGSREEAQQAVFNNLLNLYQNQPSLNIRSSGSIARQAYSTPAPLAYLTGVVAGVRDADVIYEPTAGNGMLLIDAQPERTYTNELDPARASALHEQGFNVTTEDATGNIAVPAPVDAMVTNPPFGGLDKSTKVDGYTIKKLEHLISARALEKLKDDGKAVLILGATKKAGEVSAAERTFFNWLYSKYNVTDHFEVDGQLYSGQGAAWPVRFIAINGRVESEGVSPASGTIERLDNWRDIYERTTSLAASYPDGSQPQDSTVSPGAAPTATGNIQQPTGIETDVAGDTRPAGDGGVQPAVPGPVSEPGRGSAGVSDAERGDVVPAEPDRLEPGAEGDTTGAFGTGVDTGVQRPDTSGAVRLARRTRDLTGLQTNYVAQSGGPNLDVLTPTPMASAIDRALEELEANVGGDVDAFVQSELGYTSIEEMHENLMGLQVDAIASSIYQIKRDRATIIADQTGVGKGRQAAGVIRWAMRNNYIPVFVSVKSNLFTDMYDDLADIGSNDVVPYIMNNGENIRGEFKRSPAANGRAIDGLVNGDMPEGTNAVFMTYSQVNTANRKRAALEGIKGRAVFVLDESHNAGGESNTGIFFRDMLEGAAGVTYLSATYAKRPDNMPLYHKTDLRDAVDTMDDLVVAVQAGGVPLQTVISNLLAKSGQLFRRERSFDGINIETSIDESDTARQERLSDSVVQGLQAVVAADEAFKGVVDGIKSELKKQGMDASGAGNQASGSVNHSSFTSVVHNYVKQMLLAIKTDQTIKKTIEALEKGEKPFIALENTMGSFLQEYVTDNNLKTGDAVDLSYNDILLRALNRTRRISITDKTGEKSTKEITLAELPESVLRYYQQAEEIINEIDFGGLPVSPIDYIRHELSSLKTAAFPDGVVVKEITGRNYTIDYADKTLSVRDKEEMKNRRGTVDEFNRGDLDVIIANQAGATGLSVHSSEKFTDQRPRHMMVVQPNADINIFMQMLGRINRTGQVNLPVYSVLTLNLPAEKRPQAVLAKKMKSLNANTSADTESNTSIDAPDMLNKYGDKVIFEYLLENPEYYDMLAIDQPQERRDDNGEIEVDEGFALKVTGRLALLEVEQQREFYDAVEPAYLEMIDYLDKTGQNDLETRTLDFDAKTESSVVISPGKVAGSVFGGDAVLETLDIKRQGTPPTIDQVLDKGRKTLKDAKVESSASFVGSIVAQAEKHESKYTAKLDARIEKMLEQDADPATALDAKAAFNQSKNRHSELITRFSLGTGWRLRIGGDEMIGIVTDIQIRGVEKGNPYAPSKTTFTFMVNSGLVQIKVPMTQLRNDWMQLDPRNIKNTFTEETNTDLRERRLVVSGNLLSGLAAISPNKGQVIAFSREDGTVDQGILLPKGASVSKIKPNSTPIRDPDQAWRFLTTNWRDTKVNTVGLKSSAGDVTVVPKGDSGIEIRVPKSKSKGGKYHQNPKLLDATGDFYSIGNDMRVQVEGEEAGIEAMKQLMDITGLYMQNAMEGLPHAPEVQKMKKGGKDFYIAEKRTGRMTRGEITPVEGPITEPVSNPFEMIKNLRDHFNVPTRQGRITTHKAAGTHDKSTGVVRVRNMADIEVFSHELGHALESKYGQDLTNIIKAHRGEVARLSYDAELEEEQLLREGFAEFFSIYTTNKPYVENEAPEFTNAFEMWMVQNNEEDLTMIKEIQAAYQVYLKAPSDSFVAANMSTGDKGPLLSRVKKGLEPEAFKDKIWSWGRKLYTNYFDRLHPVYVAVERLKRINDAANDAQIDLKDAENAYVLSRVSVDAFSSAHIQLEHGVIDYDAITPEGPSFTEVMKIAQTAEIGSEEITLDETIERFGSYLISRRAVHEWERFYEGELPRKPTQQTRPDHLNNIEQMEERHPQFIEAAEKLYEFQDNFWRKKYDAGLITNDQYNDGINEHPDYVPFLRDRSDLTERDAKEGSRTGYQGILKRFRGSDRPIINPLESIMADIYQGQSTIMANDARRALADLGEAVGYGSGQIIEKIPDYQLKTTVLGTDEIRNAIMGQTDWSALGGRDVAMFDIMFEGLDELDDQKLAFFRAGQINEKGEPIIYAWRNGNREAYRLADGEFGLELYNSITGMNQEQVGIITNLMGVPASTLRFGVTLEPTFQITNTIRGELTAWALDPNYRPGVDFWQGAKSAATYDDMKQAYIGAGGLMGGVNTNSLGAERAKKDIEKLSRQGMNVRRLSFKQVVAMSEFSESAMRVGLFKRTFEKAKEGGLTDKEAVIEAVFTARDITDYGRHGAKMVSAQRLVTFMNAAFQGIDKYMRTVGASGSYHKALKLLHKDNQGVELTRKEKRNLAAARKVFVAMAAFGMVGAALSLLYSDDEEYQELSDYMRATHWMVKIGGEWIAIVKPFQEGILSNLFERAYERVYYDDPTAWDRFIVGLGHLFFPPMMPVVAKPVIEHYTNRSMYNDMPIISKRLQGKDPEAQTYAWTSTFARNVGEAIGVSPVLIDHYIRSYTGTLGSTLLSSTSAVDPNAPEQGVDDMFFVRRFIRDWTRSSVSNKSFYDMLNRDSGTLNAKYETFTHYINENSSDEAREYLGKMDDKAAAYTMARFTGRTWKRSQRKYHPLERAMDANRKLYALRADVRESTELSAEQKRLLDDAISQRAVMEARNSMIATGIAGYGKRSMMDLTANYNQIFEVSPEVAATLREEVIEKLPDALETYNGYEDYEAEMLTERDYVMGTEGDLEAIMIR
jgi:hypothetical protein